MCMCMCLTQVHMRATLKVTMINELMTITSYAPITRV